MGGSFVGHAGKNRIVTSIDGKVCTVKIVMS